ncbi:MAG: hypothetical protein C4325_01280 [Blastocatellia bacterium]
MTRGRIHGRETIAAAKARIDERTKAESDTASRHILRRESTERLSSYVALHCASSRGDAFRIDPGTNKSQVYR